jgi:hypothetical protein
MKMLANPQLKTVDQQTREKLKKELAVFELDFFSTV